MYLIFVEELDLIKFSFNYTTAKRFFPGFPNPTYLETLVVARTAVEVTTGSRPNKNLTMCQIIQGYLQNSLISIFFSAKAKIQK